MERRLPWQTRPTTAHEPNQIEPEPYDRDWESNLDLVVTVAEPPPLHYELPNPDLSPDGAGARISPPTGTSPIYFCVEFVIARAQCTSGRSQEAELARLLEMF